MHTGKKTNECFLPSLARQSPHKAFYWYLRARPKAERVFAECENFLNLSDLTDRPTDRDSFHRLISFEPHYRLINGFRHLKAAFNKSFVLA